MTELILAPDMTAVAAAYLASIEPITTVVADRIGARLPKSPIFPALRITEISTADADVDGWARALLQIDCFGTTRAGAADLARTVSAALVAAANWTDQQTVLGRAENVRRRPAPDRSLEPAQGRWIVTGHLFAKPTT